MCDELVLIVLKLNSQLKRLLTKETNNRVGRTYFSIHI